MVKTKKKKTKKIDFDLYEFKNRMEFVYEFDEHFVAGR